MNTYTLFQTRRIVAALLFLLCIFVHQVARAQMTASLDGHVWFATTPLCALVLANGQSKFSCDPNGAFDFENVPLDGNGEITVQIFASGFEPFRLNVTPSGAVPMASLPQVNMLRVDKGRSFQVTASSVPSDRAGWHVVTGTVYVGVTPVCALILANGQKMFSCDGNLGKISLEVPTDQNGDITLMVFAAGFQPYQNTAKPGSFRDDTSAWVQRGADLDSEAIDDRNGASVALSADGTVLAIGATANDGTALNAGHVRVYDLRGIAWVQRGADIDGEGYRSGSGGSISLSADGNILAIGASVNSDIDEWVGHVRVLAWNGSAWVQRGSDIDGGSFHERSGSSVSLSDDGAVVAIGAPNNSDNGEFSGRTRIYSWDGSVWRQRGAFIDGEAALDKSGTSVSLSGDGNIVAIGAPGNNGVGLTSSGHTRIFIWNGSTWVQRGFDIEGEASLDDSGDSVSLSSNGNVVAIGAHGNSPTCCSLGHGHARIYFWNGTAWLQRGADIDGENNGDASGYSVSLSADGGTVAIAAPFNNDNGEASGHTRVFNWVGSAWVQLGDDIDGESSGDWSGWKNGAIALSADASTVAIGALLNDGNGEDSGHVRVYALTSTGEPDAQNQ